MQFVSPFYFFPLSWHTVVNQKKVMLLLNRSVIQMNSFLLNEVKQLKTCGNFLWHFDPKVILPHADVFGDYSPMLKRQSAFVECVFDRDHWRSMSAAWSQTKGLCVGGCVSSDCLCIAVGVRCLPSWTEPNDASSLMNFCNKPKTTICAIYQQLLRWLWNTFVCAHSTAWLWVLIRRLRHWKESSQVAQLPEILALIPPAARNLPADSPPHPGWGLQRTGSSMTPALIKLQLLFSSGYWIHNDFVLLSLLLFQCMLEKVGNWNFDIFLFDRLTNGEQSSLWKTDGKLFQMHSLCFRVHVTAGAT